MQSSTTMLNTPVDVLNYALTLEHLEYAFYRDGLEQFSAEDFAAAGYGDNVYGWFEIIRDHEDEHVQTITQVITDLGGEAVAEAEYDFAYTFIFSPRPGTEAAAMTDRFVDPAVCSERFERLRIVVERSALARHQARVGRVEEVLVEGPSKKDPALVTGRTEQGKLVHFRPDRPLRRGTYADVEITGAGPHHLMGQLREVTAEPSHRTRIPVLAG